MIHVQQRRAISGILLALMLLSTAYAGLHPAIDSYRNFWPSGIFAFIAAVLLLPDTNLGQRIQLGVLIVIGIALLVAGLRGGAAVNWSGILSQNTGLLSMVLSVGLLKLIISNSAVKKTTDSEKLPIGRKAYWHTLMSVTLFGSIINVSAPIVISDRLSLNRPLDYFSAGTLVRAYSSCASWSPFFACMAVVITAVGDVNLLSLMVSGFPLTIASVVVLYYGALWFYPEKVETFYGYPMRLESLLVPFLLATLVFLSSLLFPAIPILTVISLSSIALTVSLLLYRQGISRSARILGKFVLFDLPKTLNELQLFISAGILATGLQAIVEVGTISAPITEFTSFTACVLLALIIVISALGIHPVIQYATFTPLILVVNPNLELLGLTYLFGWNLGTCASPLSGTNLIMQGRYGIVAWRGAMQNWPWVAVMYWVAVLLLYMRGWLG